MIYQLHKLGKVDFVSTTNRKQLNWASYIDRVNSVTASKLH